MKGPTMRSLFCFYIFFSAIEALSRKRRHADHSEITVTLKMDWDVGQGEGKEIPASVIMMVHNGTTLMEIVNKAAEDNRTGPYNKYDSVYHGGMGYVITGMYGIKDDPATNKHWMILEEQSGKPIPCGVDFYVPENGSSIIFNFTTHFDQTPTTSGYCKPASSSNQMPASPITVTIALDWNVTLVGKPIPASFTTHVTDGTFLLDIINKVADEDPEGPFNRYVSTYYGGLGHSVTAFNGTEQIPQASIYWMIHDNHTREHANLGVSQYQPKDGSVTVLMHEKLSAHGPVTTRPPDTSYNDTSDTSDTPTVESSGQRFVAIRLVALCFLTAIESMIFFCN